MRMDALEYIYLHKETLNFTLLIYIYEKAKSPESQKAWGFWGYRGYFQETKQSCGFASSGTWGYFGDVPWGRGWPPRMMPLSLPAHLTNEPVPMRAKAHLVTICHRPWEWPFFRVFGGPRRIDGFPFGWRRNTPKWAVFGPYPCAHRIALCGAHARASCAWKSQVPTRSAFGSGSQVPHNPQ